DLVVGTHGRSFWILDNITPLRHIDQQIAQSEAFLFKPQTAYRIRRSLNTDTPIPHDEPMGQNPPDGAIIDYFLKSDVSTPITLEIYDQSNKLVRRFSSADKPEEIDEKELRFPTYWIRLPRILPAQAGMQRFVWDLHYPPPEGIKRDYPISAIYRDTPSEPMGSTVLPGVYTVKLIVNGKTYTETLIVKMDPRVDTPMEGLTKMFQVSWQNYQGLNQTNAALIEIQGVREKLKATREHASQELITTITSLDQKLAALATGERQNTNSPAIDREKNFAKVQRDLNLLLDIVESSDTTPTTQTIAASEQAQSLLAELLTRWNEIKNNDIKEFDKRLQLTSQ
ncbi:MAG: hypothetical protein AB1489_42390, partial [Acidobacteriota bacterium]